MNKFELNTWYTVEHDGPPPFDTLVVVHGEREVLDYTGKSHGIVPCKALAYNNAYRPDMQMIQFLELTESDNKKLDTIFVQVPFKIERWMIIE